MPQDDIKRHVDKFEAVGWPSARFEHHGLREKEIGKTKPWELEIIYSVSIYVKVTLGAGHYVQLLRKKKDAEAYTVLLLRCAPNGT